MPTGYTAPIADGITFEQYALGCARAFGALITMRDQPSDAPIPERFEPSDYSQRKLEEAHAEIERVRKMSAFEIAEAAAEEYRSEMATYRKLIAECNTRRIRYDAMLEKVRAWNPPTPEHVELKGFMESQIVQSIDFDCGTSYYDGQIARIETQSPDQWKSARLEKLLRDVEYHEKAQREEVERTEKRNQWVKALRDSLAA